MHELYINIAKLEPGTMPTNLEQIGITFFKLPTPQGFRVFYGDDGRSGSAKGMGEVTDPNSLGIDISSLPTLNEQASSKYGGTSKGNVSAVQLQAVAQNAQQQLQSRQQVEAEENRTRNLNSFIDQYRGSNVTRDIPAELDPTGQYTIFNGAFVRKENVPNLQGTTNVGGNLQGAPLPRTLASDAPQSNEAQIYRDGSNNFFTVKNGVKTPLSLEDFQKLGINEKFVPAGGTVSISQATTGQTGGVTSVMQSVIEGMTAAGLKLNPNVQITPEVAAEFMTFAANNVNAFLPYAQKEIAPYYANQLKIARDALTKSLGYTAEDITRLDKETEKKYSQTLQKIGVQAADMGFAQSGIRKLGEQELASSTQESLDATRRQAGRESENLVAGFAQKFGSDALPGTPSISKPRVLAGESSFQVDGGSPLYQLNPDVYSSLTGTEQFAQRTAEQRRASELEQGLRTYQSQRSL